ncbi:MAG TPA: adenylyl-sulfate kinase [Saprospiraceae bacterium]|nr:adenylyl-sulfate kinase [Saprospiraceae bacterium]HRG64420.1 adenylyl-sulfate kinase [Saprospiraceae bacterium]
MIGDKVQLNEKYLHPARLIYEKYQDIIKPGFTLSIAGESGSGKSTLALALQHVLLENGCKAMVLHMDDYFKLPPTSNHNMRLKDIAWVGPGEVHLDVLQNHLEAFKSGVLEIEKPLVYYAENEIKSETLDISGTDVLLIEGTYTASLQVDLSIFINRTYRDTFADRVKRARDPITPFVEQVLEIEHEIIARQGIAANVIIDKNFEIKFC